MTRTPHLAHGLSGDELPPDWPALSEREVRTLLAGYAPHAGQAHIAWHSPRPLSAAALVEMPGRCVFVKRHHRSVRSVATLREEQQFAAHVRARGIPVPELLADARGHTAVEQGEWVYEVQSRARGVDAYREAYSWSPVGGPAQAFSAGAMLAGLHLAATGYAAPQRDTHILVARADVLSAPDPVAALERQLHARPALAQYLEGREWRREMTAVLAPWQERCAAAIALQPRLWTHGDWHVSNLYWSGSDVHSHITDVLDFGLSAETFALFDLATAIERNAIAWLELGDADTASMAIGRVDLALALIAGYASGRPVGEADRRLLADLLPIVHVDFALSEVEYFEGVTRRHDHADVAWETFLLGHAAWFSTTHGQHFLDAIRHAT